MKIVSFLKQTAVITFVVGGLAGVVFVLAMEQMDHATSTDEFCTSCHSMQKYIADSEIYKNSAHQTTTSGVKPRCADCHVPKGLVAATYTHIANGIGDLWGEFRHDYEDPKVWEAQKARLAHHARDWMRGNDGVTCKSCHVPGSIKPKRKRGQRMHAEAIKKNMTCIDCHYNIVHDPIPPSERFLNTAGMKK